MERAGNGVEEGVLDEEMVACVRASDETGRRRSIYAERQSLRVFYVFGSGTSLPLRCFSFRAKALFVRETFGSD